jgi:hypothetical protein
MLTARLGLTAILLTTAATASGQTSESVRTIPSRLDCNALSSNPAKNGSFTAPMAIAFSKGALTAERPLISGTGKEKFDGQIDPLGRIEMTGKYEDRQAWIYKFKGQLSDKQPTILKGRVDITAGAAGHRDCTITFLAKPEDVMAAFSY